MAKIPISVICPLSLWERDRVRAEPRVQGSGFRVQCVCKAAAGTNRRLVGRANSIANRKSQIANRKLNPFRAGHFSAQCRTTSRSAQPSSSIPINRAINCPARAYPLPTAHCPLSTARPAFTLIEVILTLCLLVIISAMAWPQLEKTFSSQRLRKAADIVRTQWSKARIEAMRTGSIRVFRYQISGNRYRIDLLSTDPVALLTGTTTDTAASGAAQTAGATNTASGQTGGGLNAMAPFFEQILPKDITFVTSQTGPDPTAAAAGVPLAQPVPPAAGNASTADPSVAGNASSVGAGWSEPIFFYPDGTTSDTTLLLANKEGRTIELWLRGITGMVKIGDITAGGSL
jgi:hypothetical protein